MAPLKPVLGLVTLLFGGFSLWVLLQLGYFGIWQGGFANLGSAGILIGGLATLVPQRRAEIAALGLRSIVSGTLATCITAALVGLFVPG